MTSVSGLGAYSWNFKQRVAQPLRKRIGGHSTEPMRNSAAAAAATASSPKCLLRKMPWEQNPCPARQEPRTRISGQSVMTAPSAMPWVLVTLTKCGPFTVSGSGNPGKYTLFRLLNALACPGCRCAGLLHVSAGGVLCEFTAVRNDGHVVRSTSDWEPSFLGSIPSWISSNMCGLMRVL